MSLTNFQNNRVVHRNDTSQIQLANDNNTLTKATNDKLDSQITQSTATNTKLDQFSGAINNSSIGDGTVKLQTYIYGHDSAGGQARALKVDSTGRLECNVADIELHTGDIALSVDGLEALIGTTNTKLQSDLDFAGQPNSIGDGSNMKRVMNYGHDSSGGAQRPLKVDADGHLQVDCLTSALPTGGATEAKQDVQETTLNAIQVATEEVELAVGTNTATAPTRALQIGGKYVDGTFRDIKVDNIGKVIIDTPSGSDLHDVINHNLTQNGDGTGNKAGVILDAINTNTITQNSKIDGTNSALSTLNSNALSIATTNISIDGKITSCNTGAVTISSALPAGTNNIGDVDIASALPSGSNTIGKVNVGTFDNAITIQDGGNSITIDGTITANAGSNLNTSALALESGGNLATIAGDTTSLDSKVTACNTGAVTISSSLPTGTNSIGQVTANAGTNLNTSALALESGGNLATIAGDTTSLDGKVTQGNDSTLTNAQQVLIYGKNGAGDLKPIHITNNGDVEVEIADFVKGQATMANSFPVTLASNQSNLNVAIASGGFDGAVTNAGTFAVQVDGSALTSLQLIDDLVLSEDAPHSNGDKGVQMLAIRKDTQTIMSSNDADYTALQVNSTNALRVHNNKVYSSETSYVSSQTISGSSTFTGSTITNDANISIYLFEHNFSGGDVSFQVEESLDNSNFFATGQTFNDAFGSPVNQGLNNANVQAPFFRIKFTNGNASSRDVNLSYVTVKTQ